MDSAPAAKSEEFLPQATERIEFHGTPSFGPRLFQNAELAKVYDRPVFASDVMVFYHIPQVID